MSHCLIVRQSFLLRIKPASLALIVPLKVDVKANRTRGDMDYGEPEDDL